MSNSLCIQVAGVSKSYDTVQALDGVSFQVEVGQVVGLLGPNGAGKTTMIKILCGYLQPDEGQVQVDGLDVMEQTLEVQSRIGYLPENAPLYPELSVQRYLLMMAELRRIPAQDRVGYIADAVRATGLVEQLARPIGELSKGYRQRVGLAQAILHKPRLLILDEPTVGLDPTQIVQVRHLIGRLAKQSTVLLSTHILSEVEAACDRAIVLLNGQVRADASLSELSSSGYVALALTEPLSEVAPVLEALPEVQSVESISADGAQEYHIHRSAQIAPELDLRPLVYQVVRERGWPLCELRREVRTLETVFGELTQGDSDTRAGEGGEWA
jgi:ABC-2 type transport system ATP-binding protein